MKGIHVLFVLLLLLCCKNVGAQEKVEAKKDSLTNPYDRSSERGDLEVLTQKVYEAFLVYTTGHTITYSLINKPIILDYTNEEEGKTHYYPVDEEKMKTPIDKVESIEVAHYSPFHRLSAIYGTRGMPCIIKVRFKVD